MWIAIMDTSGIKYSRSSYMALAGTEAEAETLVAAKWLDENGEAGLYSLDLDDSLADTVYDSHLAEDSRKALVKLAEGLNEHYGIRTYSLKKGECITTY